MTMLRHFATVLALLLALMGMTKVRAEAITSAQLSILCRAPEKTTLKSFCYGFLNGVFGFAGGIVEVRSTVQGKVVGF
jgi:hypothetical protein